LRPSHFGKSESDAGCRSRKQKSGAASSAPTGRNGRADNPSARTEQKRNMAEVTLSNDTLKALVEAILYVSPEPVTLEMLAKALPGEERDRIKGVVFELMNDYAWPQHGIHIRPVAGGWQFSSKPEHHEVLRGFVKSLKPPIRLSKPSLEVLAVIAYRQPITVPEMNEIRGVDCGGVIHTLLERKLIVTAGRKNVVGRPILYRTSRDFLVHFGLRDLAELPSLREFEEMARQALGSELFAPDELPSGAQALPDSVGPEAEEPVSSGDPESIIAEAPGGPLDGETAETTAGGAQDSAARENATGDLQPDSPKGREPAD
jgi:segregation and condensation protein B